MGKDINERLADESKRLMRGYKLEGFTLIELVVVITIIALIATFAAPGFATWIANTRIRSVTETLQNDLRLAKTEAIKRNRQIAFVLTNSSPISTSPNSVANAQSRNWVVYALPLPNSAETSSSFIQANIQQASSDTTITGTTDAGAPLVAVCFNAVGRLVTQSTEIAGTGGAKCLAPTTSTPINFTVNNSAGNRPLRVQIGLGGQIRMCDPSKDPKKQPDACT